MNRPSKIYRSELQERFLQSYLLPLPAPSPSRTWDLSWLSHVVVLVLIPFTLGICEPHCLYYLITHYSLSTFLLFFLSLALIAFVGNAYPLVFQRLFLVGHVLTFLGFSLDHRWVLGLMISVWSMFVLTFYKRVYPCGRRAYSLYYISILVGYLLSPHFPLLYPALFLVLFLFIFYSYPGYHFDLFHLFGDDQFVLPLFDFNALKSYYLVSLFCAWVFDVFSDLLVLRFFYQNITFWGLLFYLFIRLLLYYFLSAWVAPYWYPSLTFLHYLAWLAFCLTLFLSHVPFFVYLSSFLVKIPLLVFSDLDRFGFPKIFLSILGSWCTLLRCLAVVVAVLFYTFFSHLHLFHFLFSGLFSLLSLFYGIVHDLVVLG